MDFKGRILKVIPTVTGTKADGSTWSRQEFVFEYFERPEDRYSDKVLLSLMNERIKECNLQEGDEVQVGFSHSVREYNGRYFNDLRCYRIEKLKAADKQQEQPTNTLPF